MVQKHKDVTIQGHEFRLGLVTAAVGSWIVAKMAAGESGDFATYQQIKDYLFERVELIQLVGGDRIPTKIYEGKKWQAPELDLEYDKELFEEVFKASFDFNFESFLAKRKLTKDEAGTI